MLQSAFNIALYIEYLLISITVPRVQLYRICYLVINGSHSLIILHILFQSSNALNTYIHTYICTNMFITTNMLFCFTNMDKFYLY